MMTGTICSLLIAIFLFFFPSTSQAALGAIPFAFTLFAVAALFMVFQTLAIIFSWGPLQQLEQNLMPGAISAFRNDRNLKLTHFGLVLFFFVTYFILVDSLFSNQFSKHYLLSIWTLSLGIAIDLLHHLLKRIMEFLNPSHVIEFFDKSAQECIRGGNESELCDWMDTICETAVKGLVRKSTSHPLLATEKMHLIARNYLQAAKRIAYHPDQAAVDIGGTDRVGYTLFYLYQRLEFLFDAALKDNIEPVCSKVITTLGKIAIYGAKYDITLASYPLHYLGKLAKKAQKKGMQEVGNRASLTLFEVCKAIVNEVDLQYVSIKETFIGTINAMHEIAKDTFRLDKNVNISLLTQPFYDLRQLFQSETLSNHQDSPSVVATIDAVLNEFATLESVMNAMPPVPEIVKEREKEEKKTLDESKQEEGENGQGQ